MGGPEVRQIRPPGETTPDLEQIRPELRHYAEHMIQTVNPLSEEDRTILIRIMVHMQERLPVEEVHNAFDALGSALESITRNISELETGLMVLVDNLPANHGQHFGIIRDLHFLFTNGNFESRDFTVEFALRIAGLYQRIYGSYEAHDIEIEGDVSSWGNRILTRVLQNPNISANLITPQLADGIVTFGYVAFTSLTSIPNRSPRRMEMIESIIDGVFANQNFRINQISTDNIERFRETLRLNISLESQITNEYDILRFRSMIRNMDIYTTRFFDLPMLHRLGRSAVSDIDRDTLDSHTDYLNFGWAIDVLGLEITRELHDRLGIVHFSRYSQELLEETYQNVIDPTRNYERPLLLITYPYSDYNFAFYNDCEEFDRLIRAYRVIVTETALDEGVWNRAEQIVQRHGPIDSIVIGGHANETTIRMGNGSRDENNIDLADIQEIRRLRELVTTNIIIEGCFAGRGRNSIAENTARETGIRTFATEYGSEGRQFVLDSAGEIQDIVHQDSQATYDSGRRFVSSIPRRR